MDLDRQFSHNKYYLFFAFVVLVVLAVLEGRDGRCLGGRYLQGISCPHFSASGVVCYLWRNGAGPYDYTPWPFVSTAARRIWHVSVTILGHDCIQQFPGRILSTFIILTLDTQVVQRSCDISFCEISTYEYSIFPDFRHP